MRRVLGLAGISRDQPGGPEGKILIAPHQLFVGDAVPASCAIDKLRLVQWRPPTVGLRLLDNRGEAWFPYAIAKGRFQGAGEGLEAASWQAKTQTVVRWPGVTTTLPWSSTPSDMAWHQSLSSWVNT